MLEGEEKSNLKKTNVKVKKNEGRKKEVGKMIRDRRKDKSSPER